MKTKAFYVISSWRLPSEFLHLFPLGFAVRKAALFFEKKGVFFALAKVVTNNLIDKMM